MPQGAYFTVSVSGPAWFKHSHEMSAHLSDVVSGAAETCPYEQARDADGWSPVSVSLTSAWAVHFCGINSSTTPHTTPIAISFCDTLIVCP